LKAQSKINEGNISNLKEMFVDENPKPSSKKSKIESDEEDN